MRRYLETVQAPIDIVECAKTLEFIAEWLDDQQSLTQKAMDAFCGGYEVSDLRDDLLGYVVAMIGFRP